MIRIIKLKTVKNQTNTARHVSPHLSFTGIATNCSVTASQSVRCIWSIISPPELLKLFLFWPGIRWPLETGLDDVNKPGVQSRYSSIQQQTAPATMPGNLACRWPRAFLSHGTEAFRPVRPLQRRMRMVTATISHARQCSSCSVTDSSGDVENDGGVKMQQHAF